MGSMTKIPYPPQRPLSVGEILDLTFQIYRATLLRCLLFSVLGVLAGQLTSIYSIIKGRGIGGGLEGFMQALLSAQGDATFKLLYVVGTVLTLISYAAVVLRQWALLTERPVGGELMASLRRTPAMIGLGLLTLLSVIACLLPAGLAHGVARYSIGLLLLIPASYVLVALSCAFIVLLIEGAGAVASYQRSWRLTAGSFWRLSLVYTIGFIVLVVMSFIVSIVAAFLAAIAGRGDVVLAAAATGVTVIALGAITMPFYMALFLAVFGDLTVRKEGSDLEQRISATV